MKARAHSGAFGVRGARLLFACFGVGADHRRHVEGRRQEIDDRIEEREHAFIAQGGPTQYGLDLVFERAFAQDRFDLFDRDVFAAQIGLGDLVVEVAQPFHEALPGGFRSRLVFIGDGASLGLFAVLAAEGYRLHRQQIDDAVESRLRPERNLDRQRSRRRKLVADVRDHPLKVGADAIHLIDEREPRNAVLFGLPPHGLRLRFDTAHGAKHQDRAVEHPQRAFDFHGEVDVAGGVDQMDFVISPGTRGDGGGDRNAPLLLLDHPVHRGGAVVHLSRLVNPPGVEQDALGHGGFAGVDMGGNADIANARHLGWFGGSGHGPGTLGQAMLEVEGSVTR